MTSGRRAKARRAYERRDTAVPMRKPGDRGYAAYWRQEFGNASPQIKELKQQLDGTLSGRAIVGVMNVYGGRINNQSGRSQLGQERIADLSGYGVRTVKRVQRWATDHGWAEQIASAAAGRVGKTMEMRVGWLPADDATYGPVEGDERAPTCGPVAADEHIATCGPVTEPETADPCGPVARTWGPVETSMGASSGPQTLIDSQQELSYPCFTHFIVGCPCDQEALDSETPSGPRPEEPLSLQVVAAETQVVERKPCACTPGLSCPTCRGDVARPQRHPDFKLKGWHDDHLERDENLNEYGEPLGLDY